MAKASLDDIAKAIQKDDTTACKVRSNDQRLLAREFVALLSVCNLKLVDRDRVCVDRKAYESLTYIAQKAMADQATAQRLIWDEDQG